jgi:alcohol dehydrogenase, propanol-preferring
MSESTIPSTARAAVLHELGKPLVLEEAWPVTKPSDLLPGQCLVKIEYTGLCHSDIHVMDGDWAMKTETPRILGHEGVGRVVAIGEHTVDSDVKIGDRVGLKWHGNACMR